MIAPLHLILLVLLLPFSEAFSILVPRKGASGGGGHGGGHSSGHGSSGGGKGSGAGRGGSGQTGHPSIRAPGTSRQMNYFSGGGGKRFSLPSGNVFAGRQMGGGTRGQVPGTPRYASGYPYYVNNPQTRGVYGNPFPFGYWPIYWYGYGYSDEYGYNRTVGDMRPGGVLYMAQLTPASTSNWSTAAPIPGNNKYWMVGDHETVATVLSILIDAQGSHPYACGIQNTTILPFNSSDPALPFHFQNVMQWYRSSSFALAYTGYNNTYAISPLNETTALNQFTPFPTDQAHSALLACMNNTISASVAILDGVAPLSAGQIAGIVIGSVIGGLIVGYGYWWLLKKEDERRRQQAEATKSEQEPLAPSS